MASLTKRQKQIKEMTKDKKEYDLAEAVVLLLKGPETKFDQTVEVAMNVTLEQSSNPVRGTATVRITLKEGGGQTVTLRLYDALGRNVGTPFSRRLVAGSHVIALPLDGLPAGVHFVRMDSMENVQVAKVIVSR